MGGGDLRRLLTGDFFVGEDWGDEILFFGEVTFGFTLGGDAGGGIDSNIDRDSFFF